MSERQPIGDRFPWQEDEEGWFVGVNSNMGRFELRSDDTVIFRHTDANRHLDHIFHALGENDEGTISGYFIWRHALDDDFDVLCLEMRTKGFQEVFMEQPEEGDIKSFEGAVGRENVTEYRTDSFDKIVEIAMRQFEAEWAWYAEEWGDNGQKS